MTEPGGCVALSPAAEDSADSTAPGDAPFLPPELLLQVIKEVHKASGIRPTTLDQLSWRTTLTRLLRASRTCYELGLPVLMRELNFEPYPIDLRGHLAAFLEDGLGMNKFRAVRELWMEISRECDYDLFGKLLSKVNGSLEEFTISIEGDVPPSNIWDSCMELPRLKKLRIVTGAIILPSDESDTDEYDTCAMPYQELLDMANKSELLEDFWLSNYFVALTRPVRFEHADPWPMELASFPNLQSKLSYLSLADSEVLEWQQFPPPNVKECELHSDEGYENWKTMDVFQGLEKLTLAYFETHHLVNWPLRKLKEIGIREGVLTLNEADFSAVRRNIEEHGLKITIELGAYGRFERYSFKDEPKMRAEWEFWKTVKNATVSGFEEQLVFETD